MILFNFKRIIKLSTLMATLLLTVFYGGLRSVAAADPPPPPDDFQIQPTCYQTVAIPTLQPPISQEDQLKQLLETKENLKQQYKDGKISKETYTVRLEDLEAQIKTIQQQIKGDIDQ